MMDAATFVYFTEKYEKHLFLLEKGIESITSPQEPLWIARTAAKVSAECVDLLNEQLVMEEQAQGGQKQA